MSWRRTIRRLRGDDSGASALEFALISIPFLLLLVGFFEFALMTTAGVLMESGAMKAARYGATGQLPQDTTREARIRQIMAERTLGLLDMEALQIDTLTYSGFDRIGEPEGFDDRNGNGQFDAGEPFQDVNGNGTWDPDQGASGLGSGGDVVVYRLSYPWSPVTGLIKPIVDDVVLSSSIPVRNEPF
jgi:Flp pilus assembly pilin Flp